MADYSELVAIGKKKAEVGNKKDADELVVQN